MKTLSTESQIELQELLTKILQDVSLDSETSAQLNYWAIELKPKRVRKKNILESTTNVVDNPVEV